MPEKKENKGERLQVVLARLGVASRRGVVQRIEEGQVQVNGKVVFEKGFRVNASKDKITVDGQEFSTEQNPEKSYYLFHKPKGVMTTLQDPHAPKTVADFFRDIPVRLFPVGRLDRDTTGLLLMTNDGDLSFRLTHPKFGVEKKYHVRVNGFVTVEDIKKLEQGVKLEEGITAPCIVRIDDQTKKETCLTVTLHEGKKRQIRRVFQKLGYRVTELERFQYGSLALGDIRPGHKRRLTSREVEALQAVTKKIKS